MNILKIILTAEIATENAEFRNASAHFICLCVVCSCLCGNYLFNMFLPVLIYLALISSMEGRLLFYHA